MSKRYIYAYVNGYGQSGTSYTTEKGADDGQKGPIVEISGCVSENNIYYTNPSSSQQPKKSRFPNSLIGNLGIIEK